MEEKKKDIGTKETRGRPYGIHLPLTMTDDGVDVQARVCVRE